MNQEILNSQKLQTRVDLKKKFPIALRAVFCHSFWFLLAGALVVYAYFAFLVTDSVVVAGSGDVENFIDYSYDYLLVGTLSILALKLAYEVLSHHIYEYKIELEHLTIIRGVFFRSRSSFPLARINDVSLKRSLLEMLFFLYSLDVLTASPTSDSGVIEGLSRKDAVGLQEYLLTMVETALPDVKEHAAREVLSGSQPDSANDALLHRENEP